MATESSFLHLSTLDQTMLRMYIRHLFIFAFPHSTHTTAAISTIRSGLLATLRDFPFLAGKLKLKSTDTSKLDLEYPRTITTQDLDRVFTVNISEANRPQYDFLELEQAGFPPSSFPPHVFCPELLARHDGLDDPCAQGLISFQKGLPVPVFAAQANFIKGGLILSVYSSHNAVDGTGTAAIYKKWSMNIGASKQNDAQAQLSSVMISNMRSLSPLENDWMRHEIDRLANGVELVDCPEVRSFRLPSCTQAVRDAPYQVAARILVFTEATIARISSDISKTNNTRVSSFAAIVSLLWTYITRSRASRLQEKGIETTKLSIAFDHRKNLGEIFADSFLGNAATGILVASPISAMVDNGQPIAIAAVAGYISWELSKITLDWLKPRLALFSATSDSHRLVLDLDTQNGPDLFVTSWMHLGADFEWCIPGTTTKKARSIRKPRSRVEGNIHILPRSTTSDKGHPFEVMIALEEGELGKVTNALQKDGLLEKIIIA